MSLKEIEIEEFAENILQSRRIKNKIVFLCEGDIQTVKNVGLNPSMYGRLEEKPDADFYKQCLPQQIRRYNTPRFYPCGSRDDVINIFFKAKQLHGDNPDNSYLDPDKLFAIVDLDIQHKQIDNYPFSCTEAIFTDLYESLQINLHKLDNHIIFTTGLIHKEAYFLLPELQETVFDTYKNALIYKEQPLKLKEIYEDIINEFETDKDLSENFESACQRLCSSKLKLDCLEDLKVSFLNELRKSIEFELIANLFLVRKAKPYWKKITSTSSIKDTSLREQLYLEIATYYSNKNDHNFHLTAIFKSIYNRVYELNSG